MEVFVGCFHLFPLLLNDSFLLDDDFILLGLDVVELDQSVLGVLDLAANLD